MKAIMSVAVVAASLCMLTSTVAVAADPTQVDFDACNKMAQGSTQSPVSPSASPETKPYPVVPPSASGQRGVPSDKAADEAAVQRNANQLRGIDDASRDNETYSKAYRDCMRGRGF
jgi:hypothetical protein